ncbi:mitochondrial-processing peptidase subunit alpha-like isoform X2 [Wolffia australiana]
MSRFWNLLQARKISRSAAYKLRGISNQSRDVYLDRFPPLVDPLPEFNPQSFQDFSEQHPTKITVLPNGLKIASEHSSGPAACIGLYVDCGSIYETDKYMGATHVLERMAFKSTRNRSHLDVIREIEATGGNVGASASREQMGYSYDVLKTYAAEAIEILIDSVRNPIFLDNEIRDQVDKLKSELRDISKDPQQFLIESLHLAGYSGALARPLIAPDEALDRLNGSLIGNFYSENYTADRMVLAAYGVDHEQLLNIAEPLLCELNKGPLLTTPQSIYIGGEIRHKEDSEKTHVALGFEVPGGWHNEKDATAVTILQFLMGGGGSFSAGGPGKGMHSRLYLRVLNKYQQVQSISAFSSVYNDSGLFGVHMTTDPEFVAKLVEIAAAELILVTTPGQVTDIEFQRAKNATKSAVLMNLESRMIITEDIGRQLLTYGCRKPVEHFLGILDELTLDDLRAVVTRVLSSKLTLSCLGDVDRVPSYATVCRLFDQ